MKALFFILATGILITSCNGLSTSKNSKSNIPGTYFHEGTNEFSHSFDTLIITAYNIEAGTYLIIRKTGFNRINNGKVGTREFDIEKIITNYSENNQQLEEIKTGRVFSINTNKNELLFGTVKYNKIK